MGSGQMAKNLLFLFTDQQRHDTIAAGGNEKIKVPNLNQLAEESVVFTQAYVAQPVCTPSRGTIMTGLYPHNHGALGNNIALRKETPTIAEMLGGAGGAGGAGGVSGTDGANYRTGYVGKWHLGDEIYAQHGFAEWVSIDDNYHKHVSAGKDPNTHCDYYYFLRQHGFEPDAKEKSGYDYFSRNYCTRLPEEFSKTAYVADRAMDFIQKNKDEPFVLYVNFFEPHSPYHSAFDDMYDPQDVELPPCFDKLPSPDAPLKGLLNRRYYHEIKGMDNEEKWRQQIAYYWGMISLVDKNVGRILDTLRENGLEDDTIVVFTSDHGDMMGDFHMLTKGMMFQSAVRVPLMIKVPGLHGQPRKIAEPVSLVDLAPTLLDILGSQTPQRMDGKSLFPAMKGEAGLEHNDVFIEWNAKGGEDNKSMFDEYRKGEWRERLEQALLADIRTIVTPDGWKLCLSACGEHELYHLAEDPCETTNLYFQVGHEGKIAELTEKIADWKKKTGDGSKVVNGI
jgi:arylsulfatase A-like enzyme